MDQKYFVAVVIEYIRNLTHYQIEALYFLYELVINSLVRNGRFYQLHQLLQYHIISDSVPVAYQLLSIESRYPPAGQLALDMLKRLNIPSSLMIEILLLRKQVLPALRISTRSTKETSPQEVTQFLQAAAAEKDDVLFYAVYQHFRNRNELTSGHNDFAQMFVALKQLGE
jgi:regulator of MON1-CCZ1 complex